MPRRDDQEFEDRRQQIISGALTVFSEKGFEKATNKDIAQAAGIRSPGLIYHYFKDKGDLLRQVIEQRSPALQTLLSGDLTLNRPPHEVLDLLGRTFVATLTDQEGLALVRVLFGEALRRPALADILRNLGQTYALANLARHLSAQMDAGVLRRTDTGAAVRCFIGPLLAYILSREILALPDSPSLTAETMVAMTVETFLRGMDYRYSGAEQGGGNA